MVRYKAEVLPDLKHRAEALGHNVTHQDISFLKSDFRAVDWSDADVVFAATTAFSSPNNTHDNLIISLGLIGLLGLLCCGCYIICSSICFYRPGADGGHVYTG